MFDTVLTAIVNSALKNMIAIVGPTAVGKTALALALAKELNGEIISCDSMQIYRYMDIGTAKPTKEEMSEIRHHLIDIKNPDEDFSCADYAILAKKAIEDITSRGKTPIFCGGTGLYLDSVLEIESFSSSVKDEDYRAELEEYARQNGNEALHTMLMAVDEESAREIHPNNTKRVIRALEIYKCTGVPKSVWDKESRTKESPYDATVFFLCCKNRETLVKRIEQRVDIMLEQGLLDEAKFLLDNGYLNEKYTSYSAIGYKELIPYLKGQSTLENCIERLKISTRQYAKRQLTWFGRKKSYNKIYVDEQNPMEEARRLLGQNE